MFDDIFKWVGSNSKNLANIGEFATPLISLWSANKENELLKDSNDLMMKNYNYNKALNDREIAKENMNQENITNSFDSVFGYDKKKKKSLSDYSGMNNYQG